MSGLHVVALISGGKDSIFSILHCQANGHEVVALANLYPPKHENDKTVEDLDSFMYQTIGHSVIPLYQHALGLPLFRQEIFGNAVNQDKDYGPNAPICGSEQEETESLHLLLGKVKDSIPSVNAISTGAILSDYQRTRVESVALRLNLTPLSYLWQYPTLPPNEPQSLLDDMAAVGQDSRIVKVASGGLDESFLWANVADQQIVARLQRASQRFGSAEDGAVLGEGGEFETLAIAGPAPLWKLRIEVHESDRVAVSGEAGSAILRILDAKLSPQTCPAQPASNLRLPPLLDDEFLQISTSEASHGGTSRLPAITTSPNGSQYVVNHHFIGPLSCAGDAAADQTHAVMIELGQRLHSLGLHYDDIAYTTIVLRNMADFPSVNEAYCQYFTKANPPARVTIASASVLPNRKQVMVAASSVDRRAGRRTGLHVRSRSYWAPANIGPYSQAISVPSRHSADIAFSLVYVAGQIPLIPASMKLVERLSAGTSQFASQAILSLQHVYRIGRQMRVHSWLCAIAFVTEQNEDILRSHAQTVRRVWHAALELCSSRDQESEIPEDFDVWDLQNRPAQTNYSRMPSFRTNVSNHPRLLNVPPLVVIQVDSLPRAAMIEWAAYGTADELLRPVTIPHFQHLTETFKDHIVA